MGIQCYKIPRESKTFFVHIIVVTIYLRQLRDLRRSLPQQAHTLTRSQARRLAGSHARTLASSHARMLARSQAHTLACSQAPKLTSSHAHRLACSQAHMFIVTDPLPSVCYELCSMFAVGLFL